MIPMARHIAPADAGEAVEATTVLETARLVLRRPDLRDYEALADFYASGRAGFVGGPKDAIESWRR